MPSHETQSNRESVSSFSAFLQYIYIYIYIYIYRKVTGIMYDRKVPAAVKGRRYKTMIRPAMLYGMETVAVTKGQERKMEVAEMKMLRFSLEKTRLDCIENAVIRGRVKVGELVGKIRESRLLWFDHVERPEDSNVGRRVPTLQTGRRRRPPKEEMERLHLGRPLRSWRAARGCPGQSKVERGSPHRQPHLMWE